MENESKISKVIRQVYSIDWKNITVDDKTELICEDGVDDLVRSLRLVDTDNGVIVTPSGYKNGLFFTSDGGGALFSSPNYAPAIVRFSLGFLGLKKGSIYHVTMTAKNTNASRMYTSDRTVSIATSTKELVLKHDFAGAKEYETADGFFAATSSEMTLTFTLGKICFSSIIVDEVEMAGEKTVSDEDLKMLVHGGRELAAYGIYESRPEPSANGLRYVEMTKLSGHGLTLCFDWIDHDYVIERDNAEDTVGEPITNAQYGIEINLNRMVSYGRFAGYSITEVGVGQSPNTVKQGYFRFCLNKIASGHGAAGGVCPETEDWKYIPSEPGRISVLLWRMK